jgi:hypothetical protein
MFALSSKNWTLVTELPTSDAVAEMLTAPDKVEPAMGDVIETASLLAPLLETIMGTEADVAWLLALSETRAARMCGPLVAVVVFQTTE